MRQADTSRPVGLFRRAAGGQSAAARLARRLGTLALQRSGVVLKARLTSGDVLYVDAANAVGRAIWLRGDYSSEALISNLIKANLKPGDTFFDVGANVGFFSLLASRIVGEGGSVHSFEPLPKLARLLRLTVAANRLCNLSVVEAAVAGASGTTAMAAMPDSAYSHLVNGARSIDDSHGGWSEVQVPMITLDDYVAQPGVKPPRLIKMDIEGSELEALAGAKRVLSDAHAPDVICEVGESHLARFGKTPDALFEHLQRMGYRAVDPEDGSPMSVADLSESKYNVFFVKTAAGC